MAQPIADMLTFVLATVIVSGILKELRQMKEKQNFVPN